MPYNFKMRPPAGAPKNYTDYIKPLSSNFLKWEKDHYRSNSQTELSGLRAAGRQAMTSVVNIKPYSIHN